MRDLRRAQPIWRRRLVLPGLVLLGLNAAVFGVYTLPRLIQERSLASRRAGLASEAERERARAADLVQRAEAMSANARDQERFYREVVAARDEVLLPTLEEVAQMARELGLKPGSRSVKEAEVKGAPLMRFVITQPLSGSYRQLVAFLDRLERSPRFLIVDQVQIRDQQGAGAASLDVTLSAYFRAEGGGSRGR